MEEILTNKYLLVKILRYLKAYDLLKMELVSYQIADVIESERLKDFVCQGCIWDEPGQEAHMWEPHGCLYIPYDQEEESESESESLGHKCKRRCCHG